MFSPSSRMRMIDCEVDCGVQTMEFLESNKDNLCNWLSVKAQYILDKCEDILTVKQEKEVSNKKTDVDKINMLLNTIIKMGSDRCVEFHEILKKEQQYFPGLQQHFSSTQVSSSSTVHADCHSTVDSRQVTEVQIKKDLNMNVSIETGGVNQPGVQQQPRCADMVATNNSHIFASKISNSKVDGDLNLNVKQILVPQGPQYQVTSRQTDHISSQSKGIITDREYEGLKSWSDPEAVVINLIDKILRKKEETCSEFLHILNKSEVNETYPELRTWINNLDFPEPKRKKSKFT